MTSAHIVETFINVTTNSPSQDYTHLDDHTLPTYDMTPGFKPFVPCYYEVTVNEVQHESLAKAAFIKNNNPKNKSSLLVLLGMVGN